MNADDKECHPDGAKRLEGSRLHSAIDNLQSPIENVTAAKADAEMKPRLSAAKYPEKYAGKYRQRYPQ